MKQIEIIKKKKLPKRKNTIDLGIDFSSIGLLKGNKIMLEQSFLITKMELLNN
jgi:hypothetical protein